jgi:hypothetical protein
MRLRRKQTTGKLTTANPRRFRHLPPSLPPPTPENHGRKDLRKENLKNFEHPLNPRVYLLECRANGFKVRVNSTVDFPWVWDFDKKPKAAGRGTPAALFFSKLIHSALSAAIPSPSMV